FALFVIGMHSGTHATRANQVWFENAGGAAESYVWSITGGTEMILDKDGNLDIDGGYSTGGTAGVSGSGSTITCVNGIVTAIS
ncbi:unnamed protein product, partial [marine sediment metagenome]